MGICGDFPCRSQCLKRCLLCVNTAEKIKKAFRKLVSVQKKKGDKVFRGVNNINMDAKGRIALPKRLRELVHSACDGQLVVTIDMDQKCLSIYPLPEWEIIEREISSLPSIDPLALRMKRLLIGHATDVELDGSDRILVPPPLRQFAQLEKKVVLIGVGKKLELWSESEWDEGRDQWLQSGTGASEEHSEKIATISF